MSFRLVQQAAGFSPKAALFRPTDVVLACRELWTGMHEELWAVAVDGQLRPLYFRRVACGGPSGTTVQLVDIVRPAISAGAAGLFVLHNHPSGQTNASAEDMAFTRALRDRCEALDLALHDHLVVAGEGWFSCVTGQRGSWLRACA
jgi:DNA repair protein RadC